MAAFDFRESAAVEIDLTDAHIWDASAVGAIDRVVLRYRRANVEARLIGVNDRSASLLQRLAVHDKSNGLDQLGNH